VPPEASNCSEKRTPHPEDKETLGRVVPLFRNGQPIRWRPKKVHLLQANCKYGGYKCETDRSYLKHRNTVRGKGFDVKWPTLMLAGLVTLLRRAGGFKVPAVTKLL
jgi:hypothetical protein